MTFFCLGLDKLLKVLKLKIKQNKICVGYINHNLYYNLNTPNLLFALQYWSSFFNFFYYSLFINNWRFRIQITHHFDELDRCDDGGGWTIVDIIKGNVLLLGNWGIIRRTKSVFSRCLNWAKYIGIWRMILIVLLAYCLNLNLFSLLLGIDLCGGFCLMV